MAYYAHNNKSHLITVSWLKYRIVDFVKQPEGT